MLGGCEQSGITGIKACISGRIPDTMRKREHVQRYVAVLGYRYVNSRAAKVAHGFLSKPKNIMCVSRWRSFLAQS